MRHLNQLIVLSVLALPATVLQSRMIDLPPGHRPAVGQACANPAIAIENVAIFAGQYWTPTAWLPPKGEAIFRVTYRIPGIVLGRDIGYIDVRQEGRGLFHKSMNLGMTFDGTPAFYHVENNFFGRSPTKPLVVQFTIKQGSLCNTRQLVITAPPNSQPPTPTCGANCSKPSIAIDAVRMYRWAKALRPAKVLSTGDVAVFVLTYRQLSPGAYPPSATLRLAEKGKAIRADRMFPGITDKGDYYFSSLEQFPWKGVHVVVAYFTLTLGPVSQQRVVKLVIKSGR